LGLTAIQTVSRLSHSPPLSLFHGLIYKEYQRKKCALKLETLTPEQIKNMARAVAQIIVLAGKKSHVKAPRSLRWKTAQGWQF
jgi:hypothetical protein